MASSELIATFRLRWWFSLARLAICLLIITRAIKDTDRAATWLVKHATWIEIT
jgi:hypothetical protein